jgi:allantoin racemase
VKQAEALAALKLTTSRRGSYAFPARKNYSGLLAPFAPEPEDRIRHYRSDDGQPS